MIAYCCHQMWIPDSPFLIYCYVLECVQLIGSEWVSLKRGFTTFHFSNGRKNEIKAQEENLLYFLYPETVTIVNISICLLHFLNLKIPFNIFCKLLFFIHLMQRNMFIFVGKCAQFTSTDSFLGVPALLSDSQKWLWALNSCSAPRTIRSDRAFLEPEETLSRSCVIWG